MCLTENDYLKKYDIRLLVISRSRYKSIKKNTCKIFPDWVEVLVPESEKALYAKEIPNPLLTVPDEIVGLGALRNWVLDNFPEETVIMIDDDIQRIYSLTGVRSRIIKSKEEAVQILINAAIMCKDAGLHCFGFSQTDIRKYRGTEPFGLVSWIGCVVGVVGRKYRFRNDKFKVDIDYCLQNLATDRVLWIDNRYYFAQNRDNNMGGNSIWRTEEELQKSVETLQKKWGVYIKISNKKHANNVKISLNVARKQAIKYE